MGYFLLHLILRNKTVNTATRHHHCACLLAAARGTNGLEPYQTNQLGSIVCPTGKKIIGLVVGQYECGEKLMSTHVNALNFDFDFQVALATGAGIVKNRASSGIHKKNPWYSLPAPFVKQPRRSEPPKCYRSESARRTEPARCPLVSGGPEGAGRSAAQCRALRRTRTCRNRTR